MGLEKSDQRGNEFVSGVENFYFDIELFILSNKSSLELKWISKVLALDVLSVEGL